MPNPTKIDVHWYIWNHNNGTLHVHVALNFLELLPRNHKARWPPPKKKYIFFYLSTIVILKSSLRCSIVNTDNPWACTEIHFSGWKLYQIFFHKKVRFFFIFYPGSANCITNKHWIPEKHISSLHHANEVKICVSYDFQAFEGFIVFCWRCCYGIKGLGNGEKHFKTFFKHLLYRKQ